MLTSTLGGERVLVTGGAGFIGSHLCQALLAAGADVRVLDSLEPQVHGSKTGGDSVGSGGILPTADLDLRVGDVADPELVAQALESVTMVVHFAAAVGVGQSMYEIRRYCQANTMGTAVLLEAVAERRDAISKMVVASSMSIYGEGLYRCAGCGGEVEAERGLEDLEARRWEPTTSCCGAAATPLPTPEHKTLRPTSVYAVNKRDQEELCLVVGKEYGIPSLALRFFNAYGAGQAIQNPYTGVAAIFSSRLLAGLPPLVFEDGLQSRDFVHVKDVAAACVAALTQPAEGVSVNVGTGRPMNVLEVAALLQKELGGPDPELLNTYRAGDIRHCYADISRARALLGWQPRTTLDSAIPELAAWVSSQLPAPAAVDRAMEELHQRGLVH
jgi:dTDP-L-rhamnose 4-epimerase